MGRILSTDVDTTTAKFRRISVIVMDKAPYHSVFLENLLTHCWRKDEIIAWLQKKGIPFAKGSFKVELLNFATANTS
jgi:lambda repressor-like predicted transcriptional regulator